MASDSNLTVQQSHSNHPFHAKELVHEVFEKYQLTSNYSQIDTSVKFLQMDWQISIRYNMTRDRFNFSTIASLIRCSVPSVTATITVNLFTSMSHNLLVDDWSSAISDPVAGKWVYQTFKIGENHVSSTRHKAVRSLIGTNVILVIEFRLHDHPLVLRDGLHFDWKSLLSRLYDGRHESDSSNPDFRPPADIVLVACGVRIPAHTFVLMLRSKFLNSLLTYEPKRELEMDWSPEAVEQMVLFMYTDEVRGLSPNLGLELLQLAHFYMVEDLVSLCESYLRANMDAHSIVKIAEFAYKADMFKLLEKSLHTFLDHIHHPEWKSMFASLSPFSQILVRALTKELRRPVTVHVPCPRYSPDSGFDEMLADMFTSPFLSP